MLRSEINHAGQAKSAPHLFWAIMVIGITLLTGCQTKTLGLLENSCIEGECIHPLDALNSIKLSRVKFVKQLDQKACGAATISSLLQYWGKPVSYGSIVLNYPPAAAEGYAVGELKYIASEYDLAAYSLQMSEPTLKAHLAKGRPIIIAVKKFIFEYFTMLPEFLPFKDYVTFSHYLVVFGSSDKGYWVMDPAVGYQFVPSDELIQMWSRQRFVGLLISSKLK